MTDLHAQIDVLEGELPESLVGAASDLSKRTFAVLRLMRSDGTTGLGEAAPLPGYSPESVADAAAELRRLVDEPVRANPLAGPLALLVETFAAHPLNLLKDLTIDGFFGLGQHPLDDADKQIDQIVNDLLLAEAAKG